METGVRQQVSSIPLSTVSPRRVNTAIAGQNSAATDAEDKKAMEQMRREEQRILQQLKSRDREVRAHEAAHIAAGRPYVRSGPSYTYQRGPDGRSYAIGGQVQLDTSEARDPEATLQKAEQVRRAALAPAQPSPQDLSVAADASQIAARARLELAAQRRDELQSRIQEQSDSDGDTAEGRPDEPRYNNPSIAAFTTAESPASTISQFV